MTEARPFDQDKTRRYSIPEIERRFLISELPTGIRTVFRVYDRYLTGGHLRLRRTEALDGEALEWKLGHKHRVDADSPRHILHTTIYLTEVEYRMFASLPGRDLVKIRHVVEGGSVDVHQDGSLILEVDFKTPGEAATFEPPPGVIREVTDDETFTGGGLADASAPSPP